MLSVLRDKVGGWVAKVFIGLLALSFAVWGINDIFTGYRGDALAVVGDEEVSVNDFQFAFQRRLRVMSARLGQQLTAAQARELGFDRQVLGELIRDAALDNQISQLRLAITDEAIAQQIANNPTFQNSQGQFNRPLFQQMLAQNGYTESLFVVLERESILRREVAGIIDQSIKVPSAMISAIVQHQNETRTAKYFELTPEDAGVVPEPSEVELQTYYDQNKRSFTAPEFRTLTLLRLEPEDVAGTLNVSDEDARVDYDQRIREFVTPETREIQQIAFPNVEEARAARERILAGADFLEIAKERGLKPIDYNLGTLQRSEVVDEKLGEAAFSLPEGEISEPVSGKLSVVLLRVLTIKPEEKRSFEEVREDIKKKIGLERAQEEILNLHDAVEDARAGGANLTEIGEKFDLPVITVDSVDRSGNGPDGKPLTDLPAASQVLTTAFDSDVGVENDPVDTPKNGFVWVEVTEVTPSSIRPLEEVKQEVASLWKTNKTREILIKKAEDLIERTKAGASIETLAEELGKTASETAPLKRRDNIDTFGAPAVAALFRAAPDSASLAQSSDGPNLVLFHVEKVETPSFDADSAEAKAFSTQLATGVGQDLFQVYIAGLQDQFGIQINERLWNATRGVETTTQSQ